MSTQPAKYKQGLYVSLRAEAFCAALLDNGFFFDDFTITYIGAFRRTYRNDINDIQTQTEGLRDEAIKLELNRDGIYDKLPEGIFHQSLGSGRTASLTDMVSEHRRYREEEKAARRFFQPLEQEIFRYAVMAEQEERSVLFGTLKGQVPETFFRFWDIGDDLPREPAEMMIRLMPLLRRIKGHRELTAKALALLLDKTVTVQETIVDEHRSEQAAGPFRMGNGAMLGINTITGNRFSEPGLRWHFAINGLTSSETATFTTGNPMGKLLDRFIEIFVPLEVETKFDFVPEKEPASAGQQEYIMGYGFYL